MNRSVWGDVALAVGLTLLYAAFAIARRDGDWTSDLVPFRSSSVLYNAPVVAPLVLFVVERWRLGPTPAGMAIDGAVIALAAARLFWPVPLVSGHALFLTYGLWTSREKVTRVALAIVLVGTALVKTLVWHDWSLLGGAVVGTMAALARSRWAPARGAGGRP